MNTETYVKESRVDKLGPILGLTTQAGDESFKKQIHLFSSDVKTLYRRQAAVLAIRESKMQMDHLFEKIANLEPLLAEFTNRSTVETNSYEQITFSSWEILKPLNNVPFLLLFVSYFKQFAVPALALTSPLLMVILPYLMLKFWYKLPITPAQYADIMLLTFGIGKGETLHLKQLVQIGLTLFSIVQSIVQPIQTAFHINTVDKDMIVKGEAIESFTLTCQQILDLLPSPFKVKNPLGSLVQQLGDPRRNFAEIWDNPFSLKMALQMVGEIEVMYRLAKCEELQAVKLLRTGHNTPFLKITGGFDPFLNSETRKEYTIDFNQKPHSLLTGPNRGGKSSILRSTLLNVYCAQLFGLAFFTKRMSIKPFTWIATGLRVEDKPGVLSLFETEVVFAAKILERSRLINHVGLVLFDELFHSTNPPDGARTASVFLHKLWKKDNVASFISTHVFDLARSAPEHVNRLCVPATRDEVSGRITFTYELAPGICEISSVDEILREKGLLKMRKVPTPENHQVKEK
jgi:hypothetical protein